MIIPKKLQPITEKDILEEVSEELGLNIKDVNRTYDIWLNFLDYIANDTDQATIRIPHLGDMYVSVAKLRRGLVSERKKKFKERKLKEIEKLRDNCEFLVHENTIPIILKYGVSKRNYTDHMTKDFKIYKPEFYSPRELINKQNKKFFEEDKDFSESKKLVKYFIDNEEDI
jgi:hypothetical protein